MKKAYLFERRKKAKELKEKGWKITKISSYLVAGRRHVSRWVNMTEEELTQDNRGWKKGNPRKYTKQQKEEIKNIRKKLEKEESFFIGAKVVHANYNKSHTTENVSKEFVDRTLREYKMVKSPQKKRKGKSKYMQYPKHTLNKLGKSVMSIDFIGPKHLKGSNKKINFLSCKYIRPKKEGIVKRIEGQTTDEVIKILKEIWRTNPIPDVLKVDNDSAFGANLRHKMNVGRLTLFLLNLGIKPLYVAPRSPWNNGHAEGFNSVFSKKFWNKIRFTDEGEIDIKIKDFNVAYEKYTNLINNNPEIEKPKFISDFKDVDFENKEVKNFKETKIYFLRIVRRKGEKKSEEETGFINILNQEIEISKDLINLFVYCILDIKLKKLFVYTEGDDGKLSKIKTINFKIKNIIY